MRLFTVKTSKDTWGFSKIIVSISVITVKLHPNIINTLHMFCIIKTGNIQLHLNL